MSRRTLVTVALVAGIVALFALPLLLGAPSDYAGTDSLAATAIEESNPDYVPWFDHLFSPGSGEVESGLFALQAAIGGVVLGYALGRLRGRRAAREAVQAAAGQTTAEQSAARLPEPQPTTAQPPSTRQPTARQDDGTP